MKFGYKLTPAHSAVEANPNMGCRVWVLWFDRSRRSQRSR